MIAANIEHSNVEIYKKLNKYFERAFEEIKRLMSEDIADGSYKFDENAFYVNVFTYQTKKEADCCFEKHGKYIDIQVVLDGEEIIGFESEDKLSKTVDELAQKDYMLFSLNKEYDKSKLSRGDFVIFFPDEPHAPGIAANDEISTVRKAVFKILA